MSVLQPREGFRLRKSVGPTGEAVTSDLAVRLAALSDDLDPLQHVVSVLRLQQVLAEVLRGEPQGVLPLGLAVRDVHQAAPDVDGLLVHRGAAEHRLPLVLVEEQGVGAEDRIDPLPRPHAAADFL